MIIKHCILALFYTLMHFTSALSGQIFVAENTQWPKMPNFQQNHQCWNH